MELLRILKRYCEQKPDNLKLVLETFQFKTLKPICWKFFVKNINQQFSIH